MNPPVIRQEQGTGRVIVSGDWRLASLTPVWAECSGTLARCRDQARCWDLSGVTALDSVGALLLWRAWGRCLPEGLELTPVQQVSFQRLAAEVPTLAGNAAADRLRLVANVGQLSFLFLDHLLGFVSLLGQVLLDIWHCIRHPSAIPWKEISANIYKSGVNAMPVSALVGFLIGVVLCYLSAVQLRAFGAETFIVNILGLGIVRELGPVLVAVLVAGRSGSAMTAQLGVMRVTEEIDALAIMGVSRSLRLVFPKVIALALAMPLLVLWTSTVALLGGMVTAEIQLDISYGFFLGELPRAVPVANLYLSLTKGVVFGAMIALLACHFGLRVRPNTESLSSHTTSSVVAAITLVILLDAIFAIATKELGLPI